MRGLAYLIFAVKHCKSLLFRKKKERVLPDEEKIYPKFCPCSMTAISFMGNLMSWNMAILWLVNLMWGRPLCCNRWIPRFNLLWFSQRSGGHLSAVRCTTPCITNRLLGNVRRVMGGWWMGDEGPEGLGLGVFFSRRYLRSLGCFLGGW